MALSDINADGENGATNLHWTSSNNSDYYDIPNLNNYTSESTAVTDMNGKSNTNIILSYASANGKTVQAATATSKYTPTSEVCTNGSFCGQGEWYLPTLGELQSIYNNLITIQTVISKVGGDKINTSCYYWSSTETSVAHVWLLYFGNGNKTNYGKFNPSYVRPVLAF